MVGHGAHGGIPAVLLAIAPFHTHFRTPGTAHTRIKVSRTHSGLGTPRRSRSAENRAVQIDALRCSRSHLRRDIRSAAQTRGRRAPAPNPQLSNARGTMIKRAPDTRSVRLSGRTTSAPSPRFEACPYELDPREERLSGRRGVGRRARLERPARRMQHDGPETMTGVPSAVWACGGQGCAGCQGLADCSAGGKCTYAVDRVE